nr:consensus splice product [Homo sapiens]
MCLRLLCCVAISFWGARLHGHQGHPET